ncbi:hypothetical protein [Synechococcus phage Ssp-JY38]
MYTYLLNLDIEHRGYTIRRYHTDLGDPAWYILGQEQVNGPEGFPSVYAAKRYIDEVAK